MNGYDGIIWYGYVILVVIFGTMIFSLYLMFGIWGLIISVAVAVINLISVIVWDIETRRADPINNPIKKQDESYFTTDDIIMCKIGEWVSNK